MHTAYATETQNASGIAHDVHCQDTQHRTLLRGRCAVRTGLLRSKTAPDIGLGVMKALSGKVNPSRTSVAGAKGPELAISLVHGRSFSARTTAVLRGKLKECKVSARAEARSKENVGQSVGPQPPRVGTVRGSRKSSVVIQGGLRLQWHMYQSLSSQGATPNRVARGI